MLIDKYLEKFHFNEVHATTIAVPRDFIYPIVEQVDLTESRIIEFLFAMRGLPKHARNLKGFVDAGFTLLEENPDEELVLGLVSQPWKYNVDFRSVAPDEFRTFFEKDYAKIAWNFFLAPISESRTRISTETEYSAPTEKPN